MKIPIFIFWKNRETPPPSYEEIQKYPKEMSGYQPLPRLHDNDTVPNTDDNEDKDEYEYVIEKGCFPKHRKVLSYNASIKVFDSAPPFAVAKS